MTTIECENCPNEITIRYALDENGLRDGLVKMLTAEHKWGECTDGVILCAMCADEFAGETHP